MHYCEMTNFDCLNHLSASAKETYIKTLIFLGYADDDFTADEQKFVLEHAKKIGVPVGDLLENPGSKEDIFNELKKIDNRCAGLEIIKSLCLLSHADEELSESEILFIGGVGNALNISPEKTEEIIGWIIEYDIWLERGKIILEDYCSLGEK